MNERMKSDEIDVSDLKSDHIDENADKGLK